MTEQAAIYLEDHRAGTLSGSGDLYTFQYDPEYRMTPKARPISLSLPLQSEPFEFKGFPTFFDNLLPEGWLLDVVTAKFKIDPNDKFALLLALGTDGIGAIRVKRLDTSRAA